MAAIRQRIALAVSWGQRLKPARVYAHYASKRGPLLAAGLSYQAIFAVFAGIWVAFAIAGVVIRANPSIELSVFALLAGSVPGLIDTGSGGAITPESLLQVGVLSWTGAIALVGLVFTAVGWLGSARDAVRTLFGLANLKHNFVLLKLRDIVVAAVFAIFVLASAAISVVSTSLLSTVLSWVGFNPHSLEATVIARAIGLVAALVIDTVVLAAFLRVVAAVRIPWRRLVRGSLIGALGLGALKALGSALLGGAARNPLLASFGIIIGLLIWFNLVCQLILLTASWIAVGMDDAQLVGLRDDGGRK
jgi:membrane protein